MIARRIGALLCCLVCLGVTAAAQTQKKLPPPTAWAHIAAGPVEVRPKARVGKKVAARLESGALVPVIRTKQSGGMEWVKVRVVVPETVEDVTGWVEANRIEILPLDRSPSDHDLLDAMGGKYLEDITAQYARIARYLVRRQSGEPALVCYVGSPFMSHTRLQVFKRSGDQYTAGPYLEFPFSQMKTGVTAIQFRDLLGNGEDLLITHEPFAQAMGPRGENMVIRRIEPGGFKVLWQAPLELSNLASYASQRKVLDPPVKNIGQPGTITTATVAFLSSGHGSEPVWKGKIEFYIIGRQAPVQTLEVEKPCPWNGKTFAPLE